MLVAGLCLGVVVGAFLGLVGGAYMSKQERRAAALAQTELKRANFALSSQLMASRAPSATANAAAPASAEGR